MGVSIFFTLVKQTASAALLTGGLLLHGMSWAATASSPTPETSTKLAFASKASAGKNAQDKVDFSIGAAPKWVSPLKPPSPDAVQGLPAAPLQVMLIDRQTRVERGNVQRYQHVVRQINDAAGLQKGAQIELEFDPSFQTLVIHQLTIWRQGKRIEKLDRKLVRLLHRERQLERQLIDGRVTASIVLDDLRAGDQLEWAATLVGENPVFGGRFVDQEWTSSSSGPVGLFQYRVQLPADRDIKHRFAEAGLDISTKQQAGWREYVFKRRLIPQFHYDALLPSHEAYNDQIELSEFSNWAEVAGWADALFSKAMQPSKALDALAADIASRASSPNERLRLALNFAQQELRYFGTEIGINSHQPAAVDTVLQQRFGDCKDKAALLVSLLQKLGLQASPALVSTSHRERVKQRLPSPLAFDHVIVAVDVDNQRLWLDATRGMQSGPPQARQSRGLGFALLAKKDDAELSPMPDSKDQLIAESSDLFSFPKLSEEGQLTSTQIFHGDWAEMLRDARANMPTEEFRKMLSLETLRFYPGLIAEGEPVIEDLADHNALKVVLKYRSGEFWQLTDKRLLTGNFALPNVIAQLRLPDQTPRTQAMRLAMLGRYTHTFKLQLGEPLFPNSNESKFDESNEHFDLSIRYENTPNQQSIEGQLRILKESIAAGQWLKYREQLNKVAPRLANQFNVPALSPAQITEMRKELTDLSDQVRKGKIKVVTNEQASARSRLILMDKVLAGGRLPPKLRATALVEKAVQLDHLMRPAEAEKALLEALPLDEKAAETHAALAVNALLQRRDADAVGHADRALKLTPNEVSIRYTRVFANYFGGQMGQARDELLDILKSRSEVERSYGSIWLYLSSRQLGLDGVEAVRSFTPSTDKNAAWPYPVLQYLQGQLDWSSALAATREKDTSDRGRECELYFYASQKALLDQDISKARTFLQKSLATGVAEFNEYSMAQRELDRIGPR